MLVGCNLAQRGPVCFCIRSFPQPAQSKHLRQSGNDPPSDVGFLTLVMADQLILQGPQRGHLCADRL